MMYNRAVDMDPYNTVEKQTQRYYFTITCLKHRWFTRVTDILYLETEYGNLTKMLLEHFPAAALHPCNKDPRVLKRLSAKFPKIACECDNIISVASRQEWLGVWYDMEETWCDRIGQRWNWSKMPTRFDNALVCAVTLTSTRSGYTTEQHAIDLSQLLSDNGGDLKQQPTAYVGKGGVQNMVFALVTFGSCCPNIQIDDVVAVKWRDGLYQGVVTNVDGKLATVHYDDGYVLQESICTITRVKSARATSRKVIERDDDIIDDFQQNICSACGTEDGRKLRCKFFEDGLCTDCRKECHKEECKEEFKYKKKVASQSNKKKCSKCSTEDGRKLMCKFFDDGLCSDCRKQCGSGITKLQKINKENATQFFVHTNRRKK
jgi:hypothetical protein